MHQNFLVRSQKYNKYKIYLSIININKDGFQMKSSRACHANIRQEMTDGFREKKSVQGKRRQPWPAL